MKTQKLFAAIGILALVGAGATFVLAGKSSAAAAPASPGNPLADITGSTMTAKQGYRIALREAQKFSPDSYLVDLSTVNVRKDGTSKTWFVLFYSPAKKTHYRVNIREGNVERAYVRSDNKTRQVSGNWLDSSDVSKAAISRCGAVTKDEYFFSLDQNARDQYPKWSVCCMVGENKSLFVEINALTGEFVRIRKAGIGW
jgi:hypothetical protein